MKLKFSLIVLFFIFTSQLFSMELIVAKENIPFKKKLTPDILMLKDFKAIPPNCRPIKLKNLKDNKYFSSKYIKKNQVICMDDVKSSNGNKVIFNFGSIEIETSGRIMFENDEYIKIKKENGKVEKIYKDGRLR